MATYRLVERASSMIETKEFGSYNEAISFAAKTPGASKPWRKNPTSARSLWAVSVINPQAKSAVYRKVDNWQKPFMMYDFVQNVTMFLPQPERVPQEPQQTMLAEYA